VTPSGPSVDGAENALGPLRPAWSALIEEHAPRQPALSEGFARYQRLRAGCGPDGARSSSARTACEELALDLRLLLCRYVPAAARKLAMEEFTAAATHGSEQAQTLMAYVLTGGPARLADALVLSAASVRTGDGTTALVRLLALEGPCRALGDPHLLLRFLTEFAVAHAEQGESLRAIELFHQALSLARSRGDRVAEGQNLLNLGFAFGERDEPTPYEAHSREAVAVFRALGDPFSTAVAHNNLAGALVRLERLEEAEENYRAAEELAEDSGLVYPLALSIAGRGAVACARGSLDDGAALYERANALLRELNRPFQITRHRHTFGGYLLKAGRLAEAIEHLRASVDASRAGGFRTTLAQSLDLLAQAYEASGDLSGAIACLRERYAAQRVAWDEVLRSRLHVAESRFHAETARREAELEKQRGDALHRANEELRVALDAQRALEEQLRAQARTDPLTGIGNRRHFCELVEQELRRMVRRPRPMSLLLLDLDRFKSINDRYGHDAGDAVLVEMASRLRASLRAEDPVARWGGEEFCAALFETTAEQSRIVADHLRRRISGRPISIRGHEVAITVSLGVVTVLDGSPTLDEALRVADHALYEAKRGGRDRAVFATPLARADARE
jgi:diguanylate cyclase (GGDEF)-like protein